MYKDFIKIYAIKHVFSLKSTTWVEPSILRSYFFVILHPF
ncbi:hypothetical protein Palpr_1549 [Paludibacter propionicigenes WB4]|uniref:Uncharacterized protein n=1 Tax=Paludibacter propionicigenes (strain DSM 17365 / JCM 13257 / WB4) TaxID=694427 RepID=E4T4Q1_PALPW|nr:hypothetical protein Palpr_1549 [Paludibacter propionicigenes WB4]